MARLSSVRNGGRPRLVCSSSAGVANVPCDVRSVPVRASPSCVPTLNAAILLKMLC